jgi:hypothetical protein
VCVGMICGLSLRISAQTEPQCGKRLDYTGQSSIDTSSRNSICFPPDLHRQIQYFQLSKDVYVKATAQSVEAGPYSTDCQMNPIYVVAGGYCGYEDSEGNTITGTTICDPDITDQGSVVGFNPSYTTTYPSYRVKQVVRQMVHPPGYSPGYMECVDQTPTYARGQIIGTCPSVCSPRPCTRCGPVCLENVSCPCPQDRATCDQTSGGLLPVCHGQCTPIVLDPFDEGFHLTGVGAGVKFRVKANGPMVQMSWTDQSWRNGWLVLDRNGNGTIDDFTELFGNVTQQPQSQNPNGFLALAVFDDPANGGNGNGAIDPGDAVYPQLRVWIDANHNGVSEASELYTLQDLGIFKIGLRYHVTSFTDQFGNVFRYRSRVWSDDSHGRDICYDVFLQMAAIVGGAQ